MADDDDFALFVAGRVLSIMNLTGMTIMVLAKLTALPRLDRGQMWAFSIALSLGQFFVILWLQYDDLVDSLLTQLVTGLVGLGLLALLHFGFHLRMLTWIDLFFFRGSQDSR